jgi:hypothetical protein
MEQYWMYQDVHKIYKYGENVGRCQALSDLRERIEKVK